MAEGSSRRAPQREADDEKTAPSDVVHVDESMVGDPRKDRRMKPKKRAATLADLKGKTARKGSAVLTMVDEDDDLLELEIKLVAISGREYDDLVAEFPPTRKQRDRAFASGQNVSFDMDSFAPELIARCAVEPKLSVEDMKEIWGSENWSSGETMGLFLECQRICQGGLDIPFTAAG